MTIQRSYIDEPTPNAKFTDRPREPFNDITNVPSRSGKRRDTLDVNATVNLYDKMHSRIHTNTKLYGLSPY